MPFRSLLMMASSEELTIAASRPCRARARRSSVTSRAMLEAPTTLPSAAWTGETVSAASMKRPSLRRRCTSRRSIVSPDPNSIENADHVDLAPGRRDEQTCGPRPPPRYSRRAPRPPDLHSVMMQSRPIPTTASRDEPTTAAGPESAGSSVGRSTAGLSEG